MWAQANTVHKCRRLESHRWEKKSSQFQLKTMGAQDEKSWLPTKNSHLRSGGLKVVPYSFPWAGGCKPCQWHKLCPSLGWGVVARSRRYRSGHLRICPPGLSILHTLLESARSPSQLVHELIWSCLLHRLRGGRGGNPQTFGSRSCRPRTNRPSSHDPSMISTSCIVDRDFLRV